MTNMEDRGNSKRTSLTGSRWGMIALAVVVAGAAIAIRSLAPNNQAEAQQPRRRQAAQLPRPKAQLQTGRDKPGPVASADTAGSSKIAAVINGEPISRQSIGQQCLVRWGEETLEGLVNKQLISEACKTLGIVISDRDVTDEISSTCTNA